MAKKSKSSFLSLKMEDPASNTGIIAIYKVKETNYTMIKYKFSVELCTLPSYYRQSQAENQYVRWPGLLWERYSQI